MGMYPPPAPQPPNLTNFVPKAKNINNITQANPAVVTLTTDHNYEPGLYVRIDIPWPNSMPEINGKIFLITILSSNSFSVPINSTNFMPFVPAPNVTVYPPDAPPFQVPGQTAQCIPVAEPTQNLNNAVNNAAPPPG